MRKPKGPCPSCGGKLVFMQGTEDCPPSFNCRKCGSDWYLQTKTAYTDRAVG